MRLLSADYSQVELRILAHLSGEPVLAETFRRGEDVHRATAAEVLGRPAEELTRTERDRAKANFGIIYGISAFGLSEQLGIPREEAQTYITTYLDRYPAVKAFIERTIAEAEERGYAGDAAQAPPAGAQPARAQPPGAVAGRAAGRQLDQRGSAPTSSRSR